MCVWRTMNVCVEDYECVCVQARASVRGCSLEDLVDDVGQGQRAVEHLPLRTQTRARAHTHISRTCARAHARTHTYTHTHFTDTVIKTI